MTNDHYFSHVHFFVKSIYWIITKLFTLDNIPEDYVDQCNFGSLHKEDSVEVNPVTNCGPTSVGLLKNFFQKVPILIDGEWRENAAPEEEEAHAEVENSV